MTTPRQQPTPTGAEREAAQVELLLDIAAEYRAKRLLYLADSASFRRYGEIVAELKELADDLSHLRAEQARDREDAIVASCQANIDYCDTTCGVRVALESNAAEWARDREDAERWRAFAEIVESESRREPRPGAVVVWSMPANTHDAAVASIQAVVWENPGRTLWFHEAPTLNAALDVSRDEVVLTDSRGHRFRRVRDATGSHREDVAEHAAAKPEPWTHGSSWNCGTHGPNSEIVPGPDGLLGCRQCLAARSVSLSTETTDGE